MNIYEWADSAVNSGPGCEAGFAQLLGVRPYMMAPAIRQLYESRYALIHAFQQTAVEIFRAALKDELAPIVLHWLMNETPDAFGLRYHRGLDDRQFALPVFFRTDEATPERVIEINCPAALWAQLQLTFEYSSRMGYCVGGASPADQFAVQLTGFLGETPIVHQFMDNAGWPAGTRYFIEKTRPAIRYWGYDRIASARDCNFVRNQSFISTCIDDLFGWRLSRVGQGVAYEAPPHALFDQKASLVLPFWSLTRDIFPDDIRGLFPFTTPLLPDSIELADGSRTSIEGFSRRPRSQRAYYLKYAGADWALNFGSKAVYRLSNLSSDACLEMLQQCVAHYERGQVWLLQQEETQDDEISYLARDGSERTERLRAKFSGFYGPAGCLGVLAMHGRHNKVHGREDTVFSYVASDLDT